jgi:hypothetical protein
MLTTLLKYKIYESCINIFFDKLMTNFQVSTKTEPQIGDRYSCIYDLMVGDAFYDCIIIPIYELSFYDDLIQSYTEDGLDVSNIAFGIRYKKYEDETGEYEVYDDADDSFGETSFIFTELDDILFQK